MIDKKILKKLTMDELIRYISFRDLDSNKYKYEYDKYINFLNNKYQSSIS